MFRCTIATTFKMKWNILWDFTIVLTTIYVTQLCLLVSSYCYTFLLLNVFKRLLLLLYFKTGNYANVPTLYSDGDSRNIGWSETETLHYSPYCSTWWYKVRDPLYNIINQSLVQDLNMAVFEKWLIYQYSTCFGCKLTLANNWLSTD